MNFFIHTTSQLNTKAHSNLDDKFLPIYTFQSMINFVLCPRFLVVHFKLVYFYFLILHITLIAIGRSYVAGIVSKANSSLKSAI